MLLNFRCLNQKPGRPEQSVRIGPPYIVTLCRIHGTILFPAFRDLWDSVGIGASL